MSRQHCHLLCKPEHCHKSMQLIFVIALADGPYLPTNSCDGVVGEEPMFSSELCQLNPAEVPTACSRHCWHWQQSVRQLKEVCVMAPEPVPVNLRGIPLEGGNGHKRACIQHRTPSEEITKKNVKSNTYNNYDVTCMKGLGFSVKFRNMVLNTSEIL